MTYDFGDGVTLTGSADHAGIVMIGSDGVTAWAKETVMDANYGTPLPAPTRPVAACHA